MISNDKFLEKLNPRLRRHLRQGSLSMKVLIVHNRYRTAGGEESVVEEESNLLRQKGHDVRLFLEDNQHILQEPTWKSALNAVWSVSTYRALTDIISDFKPDIAHFHNTFLRISPAAYYACQRKGVPVVQTLHNYRLACCNAFLYRNGRICEECLTKFAPYPGVIYGCWQQSSVKTIIPFAILTTHRLLRTWTKQVNMYIALTNFGKQKFMQMGIPASKITVKPNFVHMPFSQSEEREDFFLFVGRLSPEKGIMNLLNAWKRLANIRLIIIGDGPLYNDVQKFKQTHELHNIEIIGGLPREDVFRFMQRARCLVFPSEWYEGFPMVLIEAFSHGLPVIAFNIGGRGEIVVDGETGLLYRKWEELISKVNRLYDNPDIAKQMGVNARKRYEELYTPEQNYRMLLNIYRQVLETSKL